ncbi:MAG: cation diffusion facilitator family transporter [Nitrospirota bacterium]
MSGQTDKTGHDHTQGVVDPIILTTERGIAAIKWSTAGLLITALLELGVTALSGSQALLADSLHNFSDAATALPLWLAFSLSRWRPTARFTYGYGRLEDLAGVSIVVLIVVTGLWVGYESMRHLVQPEQVGHVWAVVFASLVAYIGNEAVARYRIKTGHEIGSAALVADGYHARTDALASLAVVLAGIGIWLGYPIADPIIGLLIAGVILRTGWDSAKMVFSRLLDGVDPQVVEEVIHAAQHVPGVEDVTEVRIRGLGHRLLAEVNIAVRSDLSVERGHAIAQEVRHQLLHHLQYLSNAVIHVDPLSASGEAHHRIINHKHDQLPTHSH